MTAKIIKGLILVAGLMSSMTSLSSDIKYIETDSYILIKGQINQGDFEKFLNAVLTGGLHTKHVYVSSNGGSVAEAMNIGNLIRALGYSTRVPIAVPEPPKYDPKNLIPICARDIPLSREECTCMSACILVYLGGVERMGDFLGVHRAFLNHEYMRNLTLQESKLANAAIRNSVNEYLINLNSPLSLIDKINTTASNDIEVLERDYVAKYLSGISPDHQEWLIAKCGTAGEVPPRNTSGNKLQGYIDRVGEVNDCVRVLLFLEAERKYYSAIVNALDLVDPESIPPDSLLAYIFDIKEFNFIDLLGKKSNEAIMLMSFLGVEQRQRPEMINDEITFNSAITVMFDEGNVYAVMLSFNGHESIGRSYQGHFLSGLTKGSKPKDFIDKYGKPVDTDCDEQENCIYLFEESDVELKAKFHKGGELVYVEASSGY